MGEELGRELLVGWLLFLLFEDGSGGGFRSGATEAASVGYVERTPDSVIGEWAWR